MNLFYLDESPEKCAAYHVDKHMKMLLEACQLLCTTFHLQDIEAPYRKTHENHPSAIWTRTSRANFEWVISYATALAKEYSFRYDKRHKSTDVLEWAKNRKDSLVFPREELTQFALAMQEQYKTNCPIQSYRNYYLGEKTHIFNWTKRPTPEWIHGPIPEWRQEYGPRPIF